MASREVTEARLHAALQRLLDGAPKRVDRKGKLSLNRINNEAGLGHSYIHKFPIFIETVAEPAIKKFNDEYDPANSDIEEVKVEQTEVEKLKAKLKKEKALKTTYRQERNEAILSQKELEKLNSSLMFRVFELQEELRIKNVVNFSSAKNSDS